MVSHFLYAKDGSPDIRIYPLKRVNVKKIGAPGHGLHPPQTALKAIFLFFASERGPNVAFVRSSLSGAFFIVF